jgi:hypothetical protein
LSVCDARVGRLASDGEREEPVDGCDWSTWRDRAVPGMGSTRIGDMAADGVFARPRGPPFNSLLFLFAFVGSCGGFRLARK